MPVKLAKSRCEVINEIGDISVENDNCVNPDKALKEIQSSSPMIINALFECGKLDSYLKFNRLIYENKMPVNNVCFFAVHKHGSVVPLPVAYVTKRKQSSFGS